MDFIKIKDIHCYGYTGYLREEQVLGQWFKVDLTITIDLLEVGKSDRLEDTLDYREVITMVKDIVQTSRYALVERLAAAIAQAVLSLNLVSQVRVELTKLAPPIPDFGGQIVIDITRHENCLLNQSVSESQS
jgi:dihydroneopterin aldolase